MTDIVCTKCERTQRASRTPTGLTRLPRGWKRLKEEAPAICPTCWKQTYVLRAIMIPIAGPVGKSWVELSDVLKRSWQQATSLSNWAVTELRLRDVTRTPGLKRRSRMPSVYLYREARAFRPGLPPPSLTSLLQTVERRYRKARLSVIWRAEASLPSYRYPVPLPIHNQSWRPGIGENNELLLHLRLGDEHWILRLRGGHSFRRQRTAVEKLLDGCGARAELSIYPRRSSAGDHRPAIRAREPGGGERSSYRVMAKMMMWLPREDREVQSDRVLRLRTASGSFWIAELENRNPWTLNADHVRRWAAEHQQRLQRLSQDTKHEERTLKRRRHSMKSARRKLADKHRRRTRTWIQQAVAYVASLAVRNRIGVIEYDDSERSYLVSFPWHALKKHLGVKCDELGLRLRVVELEMPQPSNRETSIRQGYHRA